MNKRYALSIPEAAEVLGISEQLAYDAALKGEIPSIKIGSRRVVPVRRLEEMLGMAQGELVLHWGGERGAMGDRGGDD